MKQSNPSHTVPLLCYVVALALTTLAGSGQTVLFQDNFDTDTSANWSVFNGAENGTPDFKVLFAFDYTTNRVTVGGVTGTIPPAPNGGGKGVKMWVNKEDTTADRAAVSIYPAGKNFTGDYALRFDMFLGYNGGAGGGTGSTEFGTFGINHAGDKVNWEMAAYSSDGIWFGVTGEGGAAFDYRAYVGDGFSAAARYGGANAFLDRDGDGVYEDEIVYPDNPPEYPLNYLFPTPPYETRGMPGKHWVEVEVRQRGDGLGGYLYTWLMNNYVIAQHAYLSALPSGTIMLGNMDIFASIASPAEDNFVIYDNVRVVDLTGVAALPVVTVVTNDSTAAEPADPASFTISRFGPAEQPLTVSYRLLGTASNGLDYSSLPGSLVLAAGQTSTNLVVSPINDGLGELTETITLALTGSQAYDLYTNIAATVLLQDDGDVPLVTSTTTKTNAYERNPDNQGLFQVSLSTPNAINTVVNFSLGGTAVLGTDYAPVGTSLTIPAGESNAVIRIRPINNNLTDGARTVVLNLAAGSGYALGTTTTGTVTIRDDDFLPLGNVLYSENFDEDHSGAWRTNAAAGDHPADLFFDHAPVGVPAAPNSTTATRAAKLQANLSGSTYGGVSISPASLNLTGDYILRFDLWQNFNGPVPAGGSGSTQLSGAGVGTAGTTPQWAAGTHDSVWFATTGDGGATVDYRVYSSAAPDGYTDGSGVFAAGTTGGPRGNAHAYYYEFGGNEPPLDQAMYYPDQAGKTFAGAQAFAWRDVAIQKQGTTVKWWIDGKLLATVNAAAANLGGGNIALLHSDINSSSSSDIYAPYMAFSLFDNIRVYALAAPATQPQLGRVEVIGGATVQIDFTAETSDRPENFTVQSSATASAGFGDITATLTQVSPGNFRATLPTNGPQQFYRVRR